MIKITVVNTVHISGRVRWYANCGFPFRSSVSFGQERSPKSAPQLTPTVGKFKKLKFNDMKKLRIYILSLFVLIFNIKSFAQTFEIKAGVNLSTMLSKEISTFSDDYLMSHRFLLGTTVDFPLKGLFSFETGLLFSSKGYKVDTYYPAPTSSGEYLPVYVDTKLNYIEIPISFKLKTSIKKIQFFGILGPYAAIGLSGKINSKNYSSDGQGGFVYNGTIDFKDIIGKDKQWKRFDYGMQAGVGIVLQKISFRVTYDYGLANISQYEDTTKKNRVLAISLGYIIRSKTSP